MDKPNAPENAPTWESETRAAVAWIFSGDGPMPKRTVGPNSRPLADAQPKQDNA